MTFVYKGKNSKKGGKWSNISLDKLSMERVRQILANRQDSTEVEEDKQEGEMEHEEKQEEQGEEQSEEQEENMWLGEGLDNEEEQVDEEARQIRESFKGSMQEKDNSAAKNFQYNKVFGNELSPMRKAKKKDWIDFLLEVEEEEWEKEEKVKKNNLEETGFHYEKVYQNELSPMKKSKKKDWIYFLLEEQEEEWEKEEKEKKKKLEEVGFQYGKVYENKLSPMRKSKKKDWIDFLMEDDEEIAAPLHPEGEAEMLPPEGSSEQRQEQAAKRFATSLFGGTKQPEERMLKRRGRSYKW